MVIGGMELQVGDSIEYVRGKKDTRKHPKMRIGIITQITNKNITVDLGKYRDTISFQDLACEDVVVTGMNPISITTSEINAPYRNPAEAELLRESKPIEFEEKPTKEEKPMVKNPPKPSKEELSKVYADGKQDIKFVMGFYRVSKTTVRKWLISAGLLEVNSKSQATSNAKPALNADELKAVYEGSENSINAVARHFNMSWTDAKKQLVEAGLHVPTAAALKTEDKPASSAVNVNSETTENKPDLAPPIEPPKPNENDPVANKPTLARKTDGNVDWDIMWPIVKAELDKGRSKSEIEEEFGITRASLQKQLKRRRLMNEPAVKIVKPDTSPVGTFEQYRLKSKEELQVMRGRLQAEGELIDIILSCIDKTLREARKNAV